jgi:hypothetical protein
MNALKYKEHFDQLKAERQTWDTMYQVLGEYISMMKMNFQGQPANGEFLVDNIFDSKAAYAAISASSTLSGMLWTGSAKQSMFIDAPDDVEITTELAEYYEYITNKACAAFDDARANFNLAFEEYMLDQAIFGTSGIGVETGDESLLLFKPYGVKEMYIDEGKNGRVSDVFLFFEWTIRRVVAEYGLENVSDKVRQKYEGDKYLDKVKILVCITPRKEFKAEKGALAMPYMSLHMEYEGCHVLREGGYSDLPIKVGRFLKLNYEKYGRSMGMNALPDVKEANILREAVIVATEKNLDPPLGVLDDGSLGGGVIDTSAGAISVFNASSQMGNKQPIFPLYTVGSINDAMVRLEELKESIGQHFYIDRLLDFNNNTQMTFGEAQIRAGLREASLSSIFSRQITECLTPVIDRAINILFQMGELGVIEGSEIHQEREIQGKESMIIPDELVKRLDSGQDIYKIGYRTKASNAARSEEYIAILDVLSFGIQSMQVDPSVRHRVDMHEGLKQIADIRGLPVGIIRQDDVVAQMMQAEQEAQQGQQMLEQAQMGAGIVESLAAANRTVRE